MKSGQKIANIVIGTLIFLSVGVYLSEGKILERRGPIPIKAVGITDEIKGELCSHCCAGTMEEYSSALEEKVFYRRGGADRNMAAEGAGYPCTVEIISTGHELFCNCSM